MSGGAVHDEAHRNAGTSQLPRGDARALEERPGLRGPHVDSSFAAPVEIEQDTEGRSAPTGREPSRVAMRQEHALAREEKRRNSFPPHETSTNGAPG